MSETSTEAFTQPRLRAAFQDVESVLRGLERDELLPVTVDPFVAVATARGALPHILEYRDQILALPGFVRADLEQLETYARAVQFTQTMLQAASSPPENFNSLVEECTELRETLLSDATALARRGLLPAGPLQTLKGSNGFKNVASDLMTLCNVLQANWSKLAGRTCITETELARAEILSDQLINDVGVREQSPATTAQVALERQQAFTLLMKAYDQLRRAIGYIRWNEGDADEIAPSLLSVRKSSRSKPAAETETPTVSATAVTPVTPVVAAPTATATATAATTPAAGLPGADPFAN